jgi:hypothetical protein
MYWKCDLKTPPLPITTNAFPALVIIFRKFSGSTIIIEEEALIACANAEVEVPPA